jgi:hypothetical protein
MNTVVPASFSTVFSGGCGCSSVVRHGKALVPISTTPTPTSQSVFLQVALPGNRVWVFNNFINVAKFSKIGFFFFLVFLLAVFQFLRFCFDYRKFTVERNGYLKII